MLQCLDAFDGYDEDFSFRGTYVTKPADISE